MGLFYVRTTLAEMDRHWNCGGVPAVFGGDAAAISGVCAAVATGYFAQCALDDGGGAGGIDEFRVVG